MASFPSVAELGNLCAAQHAPDTDTYRTFTILVMHPDAPEPFLQLIGVNLVSGLPVPVSQGAWLMSLNNILKGSVYLPADATTGLLAFIQANENDPSENMALCLFGDGPYTLPLCTDESTCRQTLSTRYCTAHAIALTLDASGKLHNATMQDKWVLWLWFQE
ncbi:hypothetical protein GYMLUDRAFT_58391 [Collybiopsis luxurians FD-317 M1]|uniref:Uncharacterized protein n=1 Tax=Collybiopsis luxurians FD-317 M1 TaxID=944289 RepID=A0A0D0CHQ4_9AGAR|nr:hypothetical protein GYMLUDRAFT_58391 [Collybiopsis luxurians FD-317 M1]